MDMNKDNKIQGKFAPEEYIFQAKRLAETYHKGQFRTGKDGQIPYYDEHILGVFHILKDECDISDADILTMALLHDIVEDTACTFEEIEEKFGTEIMEQVRLLTRIEGEPFSIYARRLFANGTYKSILVKMADRLHNLRTIIYMDDKRWIEKKVRQTYTDILNPLSDTLKRIDGRYNDKINYLADKIEAQLSEVEQFLGL
jgi:(p)ppGpp synthase/HD superfamily hydrolase